MAYLLKAAKEVIRISSKSQLSLPKSAAYLTRSVKTSSSFSRSMKKTFSSSAEKPYADYSRYTSLLEKQCIGDPEPESKLPSEIVLDEFDKRSINFVSRFLKGYSKKDLRNYLFQRIAKEPEVVKVTVEGVSATESEIVTKLAVEISFPKMMRTIPEECRIEFLYWFSRFRFNPERDFIHVFANVADMEQETLKVFVCDNYVVVIGKVTTHSRYDETIGEVEKDIMSVLYENFDLKLADGEIIATTRVSYKGTDFKQASGEIMEQGELRIAFPVLLEEVERPSCLQVKLK